MTTRPPKDTTEERYELPGVGSVGVLRQLTSIQARDILMATRRTNAGRSVRIRRGPDKKPSLCISLKSSSTGAVFFASGTPACLYKNISLNELYFHIPTNTVYAGLIRRLPILPCISPCLSISKGLHNETL